MPPTNGRIIAACRPDLDIRVRLWSRIETDTLDMGLSDVWAGPCVRESVGMSVVESCARCTVVIVHEGGISENPYPVTRSGHDCGTMDQEQDMLSLLLACRCIPAVTCHFGSQLVRCDIIA